MHRQLLLTLSLAETAALVDIRDHHPLPYRRERAAALLKMADGLSAKAIAHTGLLKHRAEETVAAWYHRYQAEGLAGLTIRPGRGRKPAFSPSVPFRRGRQRRPPAHRPPGPATVRRRAVPLDAGGHPRGL
jgi:hypothetical protein